MKNKIFTLSLLIAMVATLSSCFAPKYGCPATAQVKKSSKAI